MSQTTLQEFVIHSIWPYLILCLLYAISKYTVLLVALAMCIKSTIKNRISPFARQTTSEPCCINCVHKVVLHTFGRSSGMLGTAVDTDDDEKRIHFLGEELKSSEHALILLVHCISVITITIFVVFKMFWTNVITHACSTDMNVHCFPQILNGDDSHLMPNISLQARTNDCSQWTHESFTDRITFLCFEFTYSIEGAIVALGGVLALFSPTMNVIIFIFHKLYKLAKKCSCDKVLYCIQFVIGILCIIVELGLLCIVWAAGISTMANVDEFFMNEVLDEVAMFFINYGIIILFIFGIVNTSLFFPWYVYVKDE